MNGRWRVPAGMTSVNSQTYRRSRWPKPTRSSEVVADASKHRL